MSTHTYANERKSSVAQRIDRRESTGCCACALSVQHVSCARARCTSTSRLSQQTCMLWDLLKHKLPRALALTRPVSCGTAAAWKQLYLFNYPPLRRRQISATTPTAHELMMHISGCYQEVALGNRLVEVNSRCDFEEKHVSRLLVFPLWRLLIQQTAAFDSITELRQAVWD